MNKLEKIAIKKAFEPNVNGTIYPDYVLKNIANQINESNGILGTYGQDYSTTVSLKEAVCITTKAYYENDTLYADITIIKPEVYQMIKESLTHDVILFGMKVFANHSNGLVEDDAKLMSIDVLKKEDCV
jgi:hypothetical protein